jgi:serine/threonine protein kinase
MDALQDKKAKLFECMKTKGFFSGLSRNNTIYIEFLRSVLNNFSDFWVGNSEDFYTRFFTPFLLAKKIQPLSDRKKPCMIEFIRALKLLFNSDRGSLAYLIYLIVENRIKSSDYEKLIEIASGGFGKVWLVENAKGQKYALKQPLVDPSQIIYQADLLQQINQKVPDSLKRIGLTEKNQLIMQYLEGFITLDKYLELNPNFVDEIIKKVDTEIDKLHKKGISHRDLKPKNIMVHPETREIKIIDYGTSCIKNKDLENYITIDDYLELYPEKRGEIVNLIKSKFVLPPDFKPENLVIHPEKKDLKIIGSKKNQKFLCGVFRGTTKIFYPNYNELKTFEDWKKADKNAQKIIQKYFKDPANLVKPKVYSKQKSKPKQQSVVDQLGSYYYAS